MNQAEKEEDNEVHLQGCCHTVVSLNHAAAYRQNGNLYCEKSENLLSISDKNPNACTPQCRCADHESQHQHGPDCGHEAIVHGDHIDYLVNSRLHHPHGDHCDDHGTVETQHNP